MTTATTAASVADVARGLAAGEEWSCIVTEYAGNEQEILRLRNANRGNLETREYLDWRYQTPPGAPDPKVFWLVSAAGERVGMASLIFRPYWRNACPVCVGVLGDISLAQSLRGRGLGQRLLRFTTEYLSHRFPDHPGLVLPNEMARRSLASIGWSTHGELIPHVLAIDPTEQLLAVLGSAWLTQGICQSYRRMARVLLRRHVAEGCRLQFDSEPDESLDELWKGFPKDAGVMRDLGAGSLTWRYAAHPHTKFKFAKLMRRGEPRAFMVLTLDEQSRTCSIYDFLAKSTGDLSCMLALYAIEAMARRDLRILRISVDDEHPYRRTIRMLGFIPRRPRTPFQLDPRSAAAERAPWFITSGDKDV